MSIIGAGYVGLITGVTFATLGHDVILVDIIKEKVEMVNKGLTSIYEEGLDEILPRLVKNGKIKATTDIKKAVIDTDITFISVGTPSKDDGSMDLSYVKNSAREIGKAIKNKKKHHVVVVKSTVAPGTTKNTVKKLIEEESGKMAGEDFSIAMNPEFLKEGLALKDSLNPDRIVLGVMDERAEEVLKELYSGIDAPVLLMDSTTAEMMKYASNSFLAMKISFANEIANICDVTK